MKRWFVLLALVAVSAFAQAPDLGVMLGKVGGSPQKRVEIAKQLGAGWYRPEPVLLGADDPKCEDCQTAKAAGLKIVLVVRNTTAPNKPSAPVTDVAGFQRKLKAVLDSFKPEILVVESEPENQKESFSGTPEQYGDELKTACEVAHAASLKCTDGGIGSVDMAGLVIDELWKRDQLEAAGFGITTELVRARVSQPLTFLGKDVARGRRDEQQVIIKATGNFLDKHRAEIDRSEAIMKAITDANADYANFHWYELKPETIASVLDVLGRLNKKPPMSDEVGQRDERAFETGEKIRVLRDAGVSPIIWNGVDGKGVVGLVDKNGALGTNGRAFQTATQKKP